LLPNVVAVASGDRSKVASSRPAERRGFGDRCDLVPTVDRQTYEAVREKAFRAGVDKGMTFHAAGETEGSWRIFECWDSREALGSYMREDLYPAIDEVSGGQAPHPEPEHVFDIHYQGP
jgi:hypothetical protein